jgi:hypothetical protein
MQSQGNNNELSGNQARLTKNNLSNFANSVDYHLLLKLVDHAAQTKAYSDQALLGFKTKIVHQSPLLKKVASKNAPNNFATDSQLDEAVKNEEQRVADLKIQAQKFSENIAGKKGSEVVHEYDISDEGKQSTFEYAKAIYESGDYKQSEEILSKYIRVCKSKHFLSSYWGLLNIYILSENYPKAFDIFEHLKDLIAKEKTQDSEKVAARNMLLNTSMFLFNHDKNPVEFLMQNFKNNELILASGSIHLLRYYIASALMTGKFDVLNGSIMQLIQSDAYRYRDVFTVLIETLLENFDYEGALKLIPELESVCEHDMFLNPYKSDISKAVSNLVISTFAMVHSDDDVRQMVKELGMSAGDIDSFKSDFGTTENIGERLEEITKAQVQLKDVLSEVLEPTSSS